MTVSNSGFYEIHVHQTTGRVSKFAYSGATPIEVGLRFSQPSRLFTQQTMIVEANGSVTAIKLATVTRIDIVGTPLPQWPFLSDATSVQVVSQDEFAADYSPVDFRSMRDTAARQAGIDQIGYVCIEPTVGETIYWKVHMRSQQLLPTDIEPAIKKLTESGGLHAYFDGGVMIVNPIHIASMTFSPGPPLLNTRTWHLTRLE